MHKLKGKILGDPGRKGYLLPILKRDGELPGRITIRNFGRNLEPALEPGVLNPGSRCY
jgi:hypothetical protein